MKNFSIIQTGCRLSEAQICENPSDDLIDARINVDIVGKKEPR